MAGTPPAEVAIDEALVRRLLAEQHPDLAEQPLRLAANGWDNVIYRLGEELALRIPRRELGARGTEHELRWLPILAPTLPLPIPAPVRVGRPTAYHPWPWSVVPWFEGETADLAPPEPSQAEVLGGFFRALHRPVPKNAPHNPFRGVPLRERAAHFDARRRSLAERGETLAIDLVAIWRAALREPIDWQRTWVQGDPHPRNVLVHRGKIAAMLDWGDLTGGDRASDLASVWMIFADHEARRRMMAACGEVSEATWRRARGWAVHYGVMLLDAGLVDDPRMALIARRTFANLLDGP